MFSSGSGESKGEWIHLDVKPAFFHKGDNFCGSLPVRFSTHQPTSEKGVYSIRNEFAPRGSKFFPYRVDPFSGGKK